MTATIEGANAGKVSVIARHLIVDGKVAVMDQDKKLRFKPVNILRQIDSDVIISDGLDNGDKVIVSALDYPIEGMALALPEDKAKPDSNPEVVETQLAMDAKE